MRMLPSFLGAMMLAAFAAGAAPDADDSMQGRWARYLAPPAGYRFEHRVVLLKKYSFPECDCELYEQANGPGTVQRVLVAFPKELKGRAPGVVAPFYFPEAMLGFELETRQKLERYAGITFMCDLARRGFVCATADAYHLTYVRSDRDRNDFKRWADAAAALNRDWPQWTGIGKLTADTRLVVDILCADARVDGDRIGIIGHSLGGKMALYAGALDPRIKVIVTSDFGLGWDQSNWNDAWYWGDKLAEARAAGMEQNQLLSISGGKPFFLMAGKYDDITSFAAMARAKGYEDHLERLCGVNHATGHRPPRYAVDAAYAFLERMLGKGR